jgi:hypothetical protein
MQLVCSLVVYVAQFDVAIRELLPELQSGSQRLYKRPKFSFCLSVDFDDIEFVLAVSSEVVPHENHQRFA